MQSELFTLRASLEMSIILLCFFSILYFLVSNRKEDRWLILIYSAHLWVVLSLMISGEVYKLIPQTPFFVNPAPLVLFIPSFYFYTLDLVKPNAENLINRWAHFIPFLLAYVSWIFIENDNPVEILTELNDSMFIACFTVLLMGIFLFYGHRILKLIALNEEKYKMNMPKIIGL